MSTPRKGILLAGGRGTRLYPLTANTSKQLVAVYNKPMIYYSLSTIMLAGIREILLISTPRDIPSYRDLLGDGTRFGIELTYEEQAEPRGIAEAFLIGEGFIDEHPSMLMLGDNLFYGRMDFLRAASAERDNDATIFGYEVANPSAYGVVHFDDTWRATKIEEKPENPTSSWAIPGLYFYPPDVVRYARELHPSGRGELEITDLNERYMDADRLKVVPMGRGIAWFDTGTATALLEAANFIEAIEKRQGLIIGSPEEIALAQGFVSNEEFLHSVRLQPASDYRTYLEGLVR
ncbi:Glucose-1-phosphate thymidylyltransferase [hydrothermal vent metagenome]|uniref:glucose-1-phosphate thymidylyltransferase n=1 Tax=hydrothermal vent metagenome TaxID=652676 RepID=A0A3B0TBE9_9ZZZZ